MIESILKANDKGKIKIKKVDDNTAKDVEILVHLARGVSSDKTIDALYAFTDCEISISPELLRDQGGQAAFPYGQRCAPPLYGSYVGAFTGRAQDPETRARGGPVLRLP